MADGNASALNHFLPEVAAAARRIQIVLDTYGNLSRLPVDEETSALGNLLAELDKNYPADMEKTGLAEWSKELKRRNSVLDELVQNRYIETAGRTDPSMKMKDARAEAEEAYRVLALCLEALWHLAVNGEEKEPFAQCIRLLNAIIRHYNTVLAQGKGHGKNDGNSNDDDTDQSPAIVEGNL
jgi:hypothetical protein